MKAWSEVVESPEFKALPASEQANAREQYFLEVVAPRAPREDLATVRRQFDADTRIRKQDLPQGVEPSAAGGGRGGQGGPDPDTMPLADRARRLSLADAKPIAPRQRPTPGAMPWERTPAQAAKVAGLADVPTAPEPIPSTADMLNAGPVAATPRRSILEEPAPLDQRTPGLTPRETVEGSVAPWKLAQDRIQSGYGDTSRSPVAKPLSPAQELTANLRDATSNPVARGAVAGVAQLGQVGVGAVRAAADVVGADGVSQFAQRASGQAETVGRGATQDLKGADKTIAAVTSSILNSAPALAMGVAGGPAMATLFAQSAAADYAETGDIAHAGIQAAAEVLGERFGFAEQVKLLRGVVRGMPAGEVARVFGALITKEIPGEQLTTALQFLGDKAGPGARNPNATVADYLEQAGETLKVTIGQTAVMGGGPAVLTSTRNAMAGADKAVARSAQSMGERAAADAGFLPPVERRKAAIERFDTFVAQHGMPPKAAQAIKQATDAMPLAEVPGFIKRATAALAKRGIFRGPTDDAALQVLDEQPFAETQPEVRAVAPAAVPAADLVEQDFTGLDSPELPQGAPDAALDPVAPAAVAGAAANPAAVPGAGAGAVPAAAVEAAQAGEAVPAGASKIAGETLNRNWSAFAPEAGSLNIPRADMPQVKAEHRGALVQFLKGRGIAHQSEEVDPASLKPTQAEFSPRKVQQAREFTGGDRAVLVSQDGRILDGHHQWAAKLEAGEPLRVIRLDAPINDLLRLTHQFPSSTTSGGATRATQGKSDVAQPDLAVPAAPPARAGDGRDDPAARSGGTVGPVPAAPGPVVPPAAAPSAGRGPNQPVADAGEADGALNEPPRPPNTVRMYHGGSPETVTGPLWFTRDLRDAKGWASRGEGMQVWYVDVPESDPRLDKGDMPNGIIPLSRQELPADLAGQRKPLNAPRAAKPRTIGTVGRMPNTAEAVELRPNADGTVTPHTGKFPMLDFDSGEPLRLAADITDAAAAEAIKKAGAISNKDRFFGVKADPTNAPAPAAPRAEAPRTEAPAPAPGAATPAADIPAAGAGPLEATRGDSLTIDGKAYTVASVGKSGRVVNLTGADGKKRVVTTDSPAWARAQPVEAPAPAPAAPKPDRRRATAKARMQVDPERDTLLQALAKLGGLRRDVAAREWGMKPEEQKHTVTAGGLRAFPFRATGGMGLDRAIEALTEAGYFRGVAADELANAFEAAVFDELGGKATLTVEGQMRQAQQNAEEEARARAEAEAADDFDPFAPGSSVSTLDDFSADDLEESGYADASDEVKALTQTMLAQAEELGIDTEALREDAAKGIDGQSEDFYHARLQAAASDAIRKAGADGQGRDAGPAGGSNPDRGQAADGQGQEAGGSEGLTLAAQSAADLQAKTDREARAAELDQRQQIDAERDMFGLQQQASPEQRTDTTTDLFGGPSAADVLAARKPKATAAPAGPDLFSDAPAVDVPAQAAARELPLGVQTSIRWALGRLNGAQEALAGVQRARGRGHMLKLEWDDQQVAIQQGRDKLAEIRDLADKNGARGTVERYIAEQGGEPDLDRYNVTPVTAAPPPIAKPNLGAATTPQLPSAQQIASFIGIAADSVQKLRAADVDRVISEAPAVFRVALALHIKEKRADLAGEVDESLARLRAGATAAAPTRPASTKAEPGDSEAVRKAKADLMAGLGDLASLLSKPGRSNILPEQEQQLLPILTRVMDAAFRLGYLKFKEAARFVLEQIRAAVGDDVADAITLDHLQGAYIGMAGKYRDQGAERAAAVASVESLDEITAATPQESNDVPDANLNLEPDRPVAGPGDAAVDAPVLGDRPADGAGAAGGQAGSARRGRPSDPGVPAGVPTAIRESGDQPVRGGNGADGPAEFDAGTDDGGRSDDPGFEGVQPDLIPAEDVAATAVDGTADAGKRLKQRAAERVAVKPGDLANIRETLPYLLPGQQEDVHKAEQRFAKPDGYGMLFTNGTGTGKTFTGLGVIKRFQRQGKTNTLIIVPDAKIMADWVDSGKPLGLTITPLTSTKDAGRGITITTYANLGDNDALATRDWDLVVPDEAHSLMQAADGKDTLALDKLRAISLHPRGIGERFYMLHRDEIEERSRLSAQMKSNDRLRNLDDTMDVMRDSLAAENKKLQAKWDTLHTKLEADRKRITADVEARQLEKRTRMVALSATPFAYESNVDWAEGYLFDYGPRNTSGAYNTPNPQQDFMVQHFGYRMRTGKLNKPDAKVDSGLMQRQFNTWLKREGVLSGRMLDVAADYDRKFVLVDSAVGNQIDRAMEYIREQGDAVRKADRDAPNGWAIVNGMLQESLYGKLGHLTRRYLLEAIKAKEVVPIVREHLRLGRKVVVFHDFKQGGSVNPFAFEERTTPRREQVREMTDSEYDKLVRDYGAYNAAVVQFRQEFPELGGSLLSNLIAPVARFTQEFPDVLLINGDQKKGDLLARYKRFNDDAAGPIVALVQSDKNKGWSGHDTTGKHPRVLINLGLPTQPTKTIQTEGRIYRTGQVSNAMFRYLNTGTNWERWAFAQTIAERASAAENLGAGELARALKDAYIRGFEESDAYPPGHDGEGTGGKESDRLANNAISEYDRAKAFYFGTQKKNSRTKAQEGTDYFATPEPVGLKMTQWLDLRPGEDALEPSGGHGAIARWLDINTNRTAIEPSNVLGSRLAMVFDGKIIRGVFEDLNVVNKYDGVAMNPPFGTAGRTAIDHVAKAATHLREGGRIVALIPTGPSADAKFDKWFYEEAKRAIRPAGQVKMQGGLIDVYRGDTLETRASFMPKGKVVKIDDYGIWLTAGGASSSMITPESITSIQATGPRTETFSPAAGLHLVADIRLPGVTFERAGTGVMTRIVVLEKPAKDRQAPQQINRDYTDITDIGELFDRLEDLDLRPRAKPREEVAAVADAAPVAAPKVEKAAAQAAGAAQAADTGMVIVEHVTQKGKTIKGVIRTDLTKEQAQQVDPYTWKKDGGFFIRLEHMAKLAEKFPLAGKPGGPVAMEPPADYTGGYETDLFGNPLPDAARAAGRRPRADAAAQRNVDAAAGVQPPAGSYATRTKLVTTRQQQLGHVGPVTRIEHAANALAYLNRSAVERLDVLVTDAKGKPLALAGGFKGALSQTSVYPATIAGEVMQIPGAANLWLVHNHPSGSAVLSRADEMLSNNVANVFSGTGVTVRGMVAVTSDRWAGGVPRDNFAGIYSGDLNTAAGPSVPAQEREYQQTGTLGGRPTIGSPVEAKALVRDVLRDFGGKSGVLLFNSQNAPIAFVPWTPAAAKPMRDNGQLDALFRAVSYANAGAAIVVRADGMTTDQALNLGAALGRLDVRALDIIDEEGRSTAEAGMPTAGSTVFSRARSTPTGVPMADAKAVVAAIRELLPKAPPINIHESVRQAPKSLAAFIRQQGAENDVEAAFHEGEIHVFPSHISSIERMQFVVGHHEIRHYGFRGMLGPRLGVMMLGIYAGNPKIKTLADAKAKDGLASTRVLAVEEALADLSPEEVAELKGAGKLMSIVRDFLRGLAAKLRKVSLNTLADWIEPDGWTDADVARFVLKAEAVSRTGDVPFRAGGTVFGVADPTDNTWYSALTRAIEAVPMNAAPAAGWKGVLKNWVSSGKVKADEITAAGLDAWLDQQQGKVRREDVLEVLADNSLEVTETVLTEGGSTFANMPREEMARAYERIVGYDPVEDDPSITDEQLRERLQGFAREAADSDGIDETGSPVPKYSQYTLPGGTNYREVLLTLPVKAEGPLDLSWRQNDDGKWAWFSNGKQVSGAFRNEGDRETARGSIGSAAAPAGVYRSSHWDQPNVVAHIRVNDRTDADGARVLFVEEIQSDWAQQGKRDGFAKSKKVDTTGWTATENSPGSWKVLQADGAPANNGVTAPSAQDAINEVANRWERQALKAVPAAPFVTKTDAWVGLALRRIVKMAVDGGYDKVAFVTGEQSAERYDLSAQVSRIDYDEGTKNLVVHRKEGGIAFTKTVTPEELPNYIGKEVAQRLMEADGGDSGFKHTLRGLDLKVGGEGMRAFYDRIVPSVAKDVLRKMGGGPLTTVDLGAAKAAQPVYQVTQDPKGKWVAYNPRDQYDFKEFDSEVEARAFANPVVAMMSQPGFAITPAMRRGAADGIPLFSRAPNPNHTPDQREALRKAGIGGPPSAAEKVRRGWSRAMQLLADRNELGAEFRQGALDQFTGIQRAVTREVGALPAEQDPYVTARLANGGTSSVMRALLLHGQAMWAANGQHLEKKPGTKGLLDILKPLGDDVNDWFGWMIGNRAARLMREGRENNFTPEQIKALQDLGKGKMVAFGKAALEYTAFKRSVLDVAQAAGLIDGEARKAWDHADYIPFYRQVDEKATFSATGKRGLAGQSSGIRVLKGGEAALNDPMENLLMNFSRLIDASLKNNAIRKTVAALRDTDVLTKVGYDMKGAIIPADQIRKLLIEAGTPEAAMDAMPPEVFAGMAKMWAIQQPSDPDVVRVMEGGRPLFYRVNDPLLLKALTSFVPFDFPGLAVMRGAKRLLTAMVTSTPEFMIRNWIRDSTAAQAIARDGFNPAQSIAGVVKSYRETGGFEPMLFAGASFQSGNINAANPEATGVAMRRALRDRGLSAASTSAFMGSLLDTPAKVWEKYRQVGEAIENANREAVYEATKKAGNSPTEAAFEAKDLMDFSLRGSWPAYQLLADVLPFFNARVQGLYRLGRSDPKRLAAVGGVIMVASMLLAMANDGEDWYEELPDWDKDTNWHFRIGGQHFRIPKPFEIGVIFATIPERIGRSIKGLDTGKKTLGRVWANLRDQLAFDPVPQLVRPVLNVWANHDTFRDSPIENTADEGKSPSARFNARTSDTMRVLADVAEPISDATGLSPKRMEYLVNGYFGTVGLYALGLSDMLVRQIEGKPPGPSLRADDIPVVRAFYRVDPARSTVFESDLYKLRTEVEQVAKEVRALEKDGKDQAAAEKRAKDRDKLVARPAVVGATSQLAALNKQRDKIYADPTMSPDEKRRQIDALQVRKNAIAKKAMTVPAVRALQ